MTDSRTGFDEDSLPWLQEVEDEDAPRGISARAMLVGLIAVLLVAGAVAAAFFLLGRQGGGSAPGAPELIRAPSEPYKVKSTDPGALDVAGESQTTFETSAGRDVDSRLNVEAPGEQIAPPAAQTEPKRIPPGEKKAPAPAAETAPVTAAPSGATGSVIQLGAFKNTAQAERAWTALSARFGALSGMAKMIVPYSAGGSSGYRLRAAATSPEAARAACRQVQAGGESCFIAR